MFTTFESNLYFGFLCQFFTLVNMKNLKLLKAQQESAIAADNFCIDIDKNVYIGSSKTLYTIEKSSKEVIPCGELISEVVENYNNYVIGMEFLFESMNIFIATSVGDLYLYNVDEQMISSVGFVETGIEGFAWSPDQEFLVLLTGENTLILMTKEFDAITEKNLCTDEFGESKPINVGWGSKTTQFHGSEGKEAAHVKQKEPHQALSYDDRKPRISWRKDGEYFVTSSVDPTKNYRLLRIWSQEAILQYTSEVVEGLEEPVCWRPLGNLIACSQQCPNKHQIIFFEKNGLRHGEFTLPFKPNTFKVSTMSWNSDSSILLVVAEELCDNPIDFHVMLWTSSNYHWYLKQKLLLTISTPYKPLIAKWSSFHPNELQCYNQSTGDLYSFKWTWCILRASVNDICDDGIVASIDNDKLLVSPFGKLYVPPPSCAYMYCATSSIQSVFFAPNIPAFAAYIEDSKLLIFKKDSSALSSEDCKIVSLHGNGFKGIIPYVLYGIYNIQYENDCPSLFGLSHWTWTAKNILCVGSLIRNNEDPMYCILSFDIPSESSELNSQLQGRILAKVDISVIGMCSNEDGKLIAVQLDDGKVFQIHSDLLNLNEESSLLKPWVMDNDKNLVLPQTCPTMSVLTISGKDYFLGLSEKYNLFCNDYIILSGCTSYFIEKDFLLATTASNVIKCFSKKFDLPDAIAKKGQLSTEVPTRTIEKGARIVNVPNNSTSAILQMPRGNLEGIHLRALVLSVICNHLDHSLFGKALELAKKHGIDVNLLYDHNPQQFLDKIEDVIDQIDSPSNLIPFLTHLKNEDVRSTMYPLSFKDCVQHNSSTTSVNKINVIHDAFRKVLDSRNDPRYFHALLVTYVKKEPSELDQALKRVKRLKDSDDLKSTRDTVDMALNFLLYLVDAHDLSNAALETYDLEIAVMVDQKSQKDPKEFLAFYNNLQQLEENYRKFKIDMHLKKFKRALVNISNCEDKFDECLQLIKDQRLYTEALNIFPSSSAQRQAIWGEYGNYLMSKRYFDEAGMVFTRCEMHEKALLAYTEGVNWQMALYSANSLSYKGNKIAQLCQDLSAKLKSHQKYLDAAHLLEHYVQDSEEAIVTLVEGCEWNMAMMMISKYNRYDLEESHFIPALKEHHVNLKSHLEQLFKTFSQHSERLKIVRTQKKVKTEESNAITFADDELFSDIGSVTDAASSCVESKQSGSIMTRKSSKNRKKLKLKKYRLKEGSADEDLALIVALSEITTKIDTLKDNFLNTLKAMVHFEFDDAAKTLQELMMKIISVVETEMPIIWNPLENIGSTPDMKFGPDSTVNSITATLQSGNKASPTNIDPELAAPPWRKIELSLQMFN
ncbi:elongator complex protein 1 [Caerostris darwini]|uniref:Elongator complex protein 1 n=1 Tax=Caerostris darwini TaxID=1538125 RepID=A0AAV4X2T9_9ARAC|nr:elongator complex protein 1 [Caerostris darwini]